MSGGITGRMSGWMPGGYDAYRNSNFGVLLWIFRFFLMTYLCCHIINNVGHILLMAPIGITSVFLFLLSLIRFILLGFVSCAMEITCE